jgi:hypothetical protein
MTAVKYSGSAGLRCLFSLSLANSAGAMYLRSRKVPSLTVHILPRFVFLNHLHYKSWRTCPQVQCRSESFRGPKCLQAQSAENDCRSLRMARTRLHDPE